MTPIDEHWLARSHALGRAQARYLWVLLIAVLFYAALRSAAQASAGSGAQLQVPVIDLALDAKIVLASGAAVLSFLVLVVTGSLRAYSHARSNLGAGTGADYKGERLDLYPNAIDLAVYTTKESPRLLAVLAYFTYPAFLALALAMAAILWWDIWSGSRITVAGRWWFVVVGAIFWIPAAWQVLAISIGRVRKIPQLWKVGAA